MFRYPDPEKIEVLSSTSPLPNIAMVIDPTYTPVRHGSNVTSPAISLPPPGTFSFHHPTIRNIFLNPMWFSF